MLTNVLSLAHLDVRVLLFCLHANRLQVLLTRAPQNLEKQWALPGNPITLDASLDG